MCSLLRETEKWYLEWLEAIINSTEESEYTVSLCAKVIKSPRKFCEPSVIIGLFNPSVII